MFHHNILKSTMEDEPTIGSSANRQSQDVEASMVKAATTGGVPATCTPESTHSGTNDYTSKKKKRTESSFVVVSEPQSLPTVDDGDSGESQGKGGTIHMRQASFPGPYPEMTNHATGMDPAPASRSYPQQHVPQPSSQLAHVNSSASVALNQPRPSGSSPAPDQGFSNANFQSADNYTPSVAPLGTYVQYSGPSSESYPSFAQTGRPKPHNILHFPSRDVYATPETLAQTAEQQRQQQSQGYHAPKTLQRSQTRYYGVNSQMPFRRQIDAFVANDPWRPQTRRKHQKDVESFDEIPLPSKDHETYPPYSPYPSMPLGNTPEATVPVQQPTTRTRISRDDDGSSSKSRQPSRPNLDVDPSGHVHPDYADSIYMDAPQLIPPESPPLPAPSSAVGSPRSAPSSVNVIDPPYDMFHPSLPHERTLLGGVIEFMKRITTAVGMKDHDIERPEYVLETSLHPTNRPTSEPSQEFII